jgi:hydrogenase nickel incorporation protein HypA/HybF
MHEVGIMESALDTVFRELRARGGQRVHRIVLRVGAVSGVEPEALKFAFEAVAPDTAAAGAVLEIELAPARAFCAPCAEEFVVASTFIFTCPRCGRPSGEIRAGRELELQRMEIS